MVVKPFLTHYFSSMDQQQWILGYKGYGQTLQPLSETKLTGHVTDQTYPRISVHAISINPVDYKILKGEQRLLMNKTFPKVFGTDFFGMYESSPSSTPQPVIGMTNPLVYGSCRSFIDPKRATYTEILSLNPDACSLPAAGLTALYTLSKQERSVLKSLLQTGLIKTSSTKEQKTVLILGANGGVGVYAIQLYNLLGYKIMVSCSKKWHSWMIDQGIQQVYDRGEVPSDETFDRIVDCPGILTPNQVRLLSLTKQKKKTTYVPISIPNNQIFTRLKEALFQALYYKTKILLAVPNQSSLDLLTKLYKQQYIKLCPIQFFPLSQGAKAIQTAQAGGFLGKIGILLDL